jgi:hypothetical protein
MQDISSCIKDASIQLGVLRTVQPEHTRSNNVDDDEDDDDDSSPKTPNMKSSPSPDDEVPEITTMKMNGYTSSLKPTFGRNGPTPGSPGRRAGQNKVDSKVLKEEHDRFRDTVKVAGMTMVRWLNLAHAVAIGDLIEKYPNDFSYMDDLERLGLITKRETYLLSKASDEPIFFRGSSCSGRPSRHRRYDVPVAWFYEWLYQIEQSETLRIPPVCLGILDRSVSRIRQSLDTLYMFRDTPVPLMYRQIVQMTVRLYMVIFLIGDGLLAIYHGITLAEAEGEVLAIYNGTDAQEEYVRMNLPNYLRSLYYMILPFAFEYFVFVG